MRNEKPGIGTVLITAGICLGIYLVYSIAILTGKVFVLCGYNCFFFLDNLFAIAPFNPIATWGIFGLSIGSIVGVIVAIKKYNLSKKLALYPITFVVALISIMSFINKPSHYTGSYAEVKETDTALKKTYYILNTNSNVRSGPFANKPKLFGLAKGTEVEVIEKGLYDSGNSEWFKIRYLGQEGYINSKLLVYSRSVPLSETPSEVPTEVPEPPDNTPIEELTPMNPDPIETEIKTEENTTDPSEGQQTSSDEETHPEPPSFDEIKEMLLDKDHCGIACKDVGQIKKLKLVRDWKYDGNSASNAISFVVHSEDYETSEPCQYEIVIRYKSDNWVLKNLK